jgi:hypothetical protein
LKYISLNPTIPIDGAGAMIVIACPSKETDQLLLNDHDDNNTSKVKSAQQLVILLNTIFIILQL